MCCNLKITIYSRAKQLQTKQLSDRSRAEQTDHLKELLTRAKKFRHTQLLIHCGIAPWQRYMEMLRLVALLLCFFLHCYPFWVCSVCPVFVFDIVHEFAQQFLWCYFFALFPDVAAGWTVSKPFTSATTGCCWRHGRRCLDISSPCARSASAESIASPEWPSLTTGTVRHSVSLSTFCVLLRNRMVKSQPCYMFGQDLIKCCARV